MVAKHGSTYAIHLNFGLASIGIVPPIVGLLIDYSSTFDNVNLYLAFFIFGGFEIISLILVFVLDLQVEIHMASIPKELKRMFTNVEAVTLMIMDFLLGYLLYF